VSGSAATNVEVPRELRSLSQDVLDKLSKRFFASANKEVVKAEFMIAARCSEAAVMGLFTRLEKLGLATIWAKAFEAESGSYWKEFRFSEGPPPLPAEVDSDDGIVVITEPQQLAYEITAMVAQPVHLVRGQRE
jgi:hypothetical protein